MTTRLRLGVLALSVVAVLPGCSAGSTDRPAERNSPSTRAEGARDVPDVARWRTPRTGLCGDLLRGLPDSWAVSTEVITPGQDEVDVTCILLRDDTEGASAAAVSMAVGKSARPSYEVWLAPYENAEADLEAPTVSAVDGWEEGQRYVSTEGWRGSAAELVHSEGIAIRVVVMHGRVRGQTGAAYDASIARLNDEASDVADAVVSAAADTLGE